MQPKFITPVMSKLPYIADNVDGATSFWYVHPGRGNDCSECTLESGGTRGICQPLTLRYTRISYYASLPLYATREYDSYYYIQQGNDIRYQSCVLYQSVLTWYRRTCNLRSNLIFSRESILTKICLMQLYLTRGMIVITWFFKDRGYERKLYPGRVEHENSVTSAMRLAAYNYRERIFDSLVFRATASRTRGRH